MNHRFEHSWGFDVDPRPEINPSGLSRKPKILDASSKRCRRQPAPPTITAGGSDFVVLVVETLASHHHSGKLPSAPKINPVHLLTYLSTGVNNICDIKSCKDPQRPKNKILDEESPRCHFSTSGPYRNEARAPRQQNPRTPRA